MKNNTRSEQLDITPADRIVVLTPTKLAGTSTIEVAEEKPPDLGKVICFGGPGYSEEGNLRFSPLVFDKGDIIAYRKFGESSFYIEGKLFKFVSFDDVLAIVKKKGKK